MQIKCKVADIGLRDLVHGKTVKTMAIVHLVPVEHPIGNIVVGVEVTGPDDPNITWHAEEVWKDKEDRPIKTVVGKQTLIIGVKGKVDGDDTCEFHQFSEYTVSVELENKVAIKPSVGQDGKPLRTDGF